MLNMNCRSIIDQMNRITHFVMFSMVLFGQEIGDGGPAFEVVSINLVDSTVPRRYSGGPGSDDPGQITWTRTSVRMLIVAAWRDVYDRRISGPSWLDSEFAVTAKVPREATRDDLRLMFRRMLVERFGLSFHSEDHRSAAYELRVARPGSRLRALPVRPDKLKGGPGFESVRQPDGSNRLTFQNSTMFYLANTLSSEYSQGRIPVFDRTGVEGAFDFSFEMPAGQGEAGDPAYGVEGVSAYLEMQLGLKLVRTHTELKSMVIDHLNKVPTAN